MIEKLRDDALKIFKEALKVVLPERSVKEYLEKFGTKANEVFIIAIGKAAWRMAKAASEVFENAKIRYSGIVLTKYKHSLGEIQNFKILEAAHPIPDENSMKGAKKILETLKKLKKDTEVLFLISGGGSSLFEIPMESLNLEDMIRTSELLLKSGATIREINTVRKHLSKVKGGRVAELMPHLKITTLILSDVIGDPPDMIASGPTVPDKTTFSDVWKVFEKYDLIDKLPKNVLKFVEDGLNGLEPETPKELDNVEVYIIGNLGKACEAALKKAKSMNYEAMILSTFIECEAREAGKFLAGIAKEILKTGRPLKPPCVIISGGETVVKVKGKGKGGRNQELALSFAIEMEEVENIALLSAGTDGTDGPTDAAGGLVDGYTTIRIRKHGIDPVDLLNNNDSYNALKMSGDLLITGPTGTNVNDIMILICGKHGD